MNRTSSSRPPESIPEKLEVAKMKSLTPVRSNAEMERNYAQLCQWLFLTTPLNRGEVHAQATTTPEMMVHELENVILRFEVDNEPSAWVETVKPNLPWAEDHFQERVSGEPLNPPPSEQWWPFAVQGNTAHKSADRFSHTYPERFWPRFAGDNPTHERARRGFKFSNFGIRFEYGDLEDLVNLLRINPLSRQAYLPIWFPEDLNAANHRERVPCSLGYHFLVDAQGRMNMTYSLRSCDLVRFFRDDAYMAGRLLQWVSAQIPDIDPGILTMHIYNLHAFVGDRHFLVQHSTPTEVDVRNSYNFGALG